MLKALLLFSDPFNKQTSLKSKEKKFLNPFAVLNGHKTEF